MRTKKATINSISNMFIYIIILLPTFITRRFFLNILGEDLLGLNSLYTNIVSLLSIMELGVGTAIIYSLYKPFADGKREKIKAYLKFYKKFYVNIGLFIFIAGILITPFIQIFINGDVDISKARFYFILFLLNTVFSYLFSYKICILNVAQEGYIVSLLTGISKTLISIIQIIMLKVYPNFALYIIIQVIVDLIYYIVVNSIINKKYPWINKVDGCLEESEKAGLLKNLKALLLHKIGSFVVFSTDNLIISTFINLQTVTRFNSYNMVISALQSMISRGFEGLTASIGNLIVKDTKEKIYDIYKKVFFLNFWLVSFISISLFNTLDQFVVLWLGRTQKLDIFTLSILIINFYFLAMRLSIDKFKDGGGIYYQDRYAPICEAIINLISSIILVNIIGLPGVFLGTLISNFTVVFWVKPLVVYRNVFDVSVVEYFKEYFQYIIIAIIPLVITRILTTPLRAEISIGSFILNCIVNICVINGIYLILFYKKSEFKYFKDLLLKVLRKAKI